MVNVDFGIQVDGMIAKSAFTLSEEEEMSNLVLSSKEAMDKGIEMAGLDARVEEIAKAMLEVAES